MIHFVGIGGAGMCALAEVLLRRGARVSGCDLRSSPSTERLGRLGAQVALGHDPAHLAGCARVVASRAVPSHTPELQQARRWGIPVVHRAQMLGEILRSGPSIGVAGTHGKTTTTALLSVALTGAGMDPTALVGGEVRAFGSYARVGTGPIVAEVDESDGSLLDVRPSAAVITSLDLTDHVDHYRDLGRLRATFEAFVGSLDPDGFVLLCAESPEAARLGSASRARPITYGLEAGEVRARILARQGPSSEFVLSVRGREVGLVRLPLPGRHNVLNAAAALAAGLELGAAFEPMAEALRTFAGVRRRFEIYAHHPLVVDDYAHNPVKVRSLLRALREGWPDARIVAVFQPHRYSRTATTYTQYADAFDDADELVITDIYPADEPPIPGVSARLIVDAVRSRRPVLWIGGLLDAAEYVRSRLRPEDILVTMGAGDVWKVAQLVAGALAGGTP